MKYYILALACILALSCKEDEPGTDQGCLTGVRIGPQYQYRESIRCSTKQEFEAGVDETENWEDFHSHEWAPCEDCQ